MTRTGTSTRNVIANDRWPQPVGQGRKFEDPVASEARILLLLLSELRAAQLEVARIEAEIAPHARAFADANGEYLRPTLTQLHRRLGVPS